MLHVLTLYYKVASSQLPAPQIAPRTKVVLESRQFSSSSSPDTPRTKVVLQSRQFSSSSSPDTPRTTVVLQRHDLRRGFPASRVNRALAYISRTRHARSPQRAHTGRIALSPSFRALDTHDLRRGLRAHQTNRTLACISRTRHARSPQRVARTPDRSHSRLHFAHSTRTISAEGCIFG